MILNFTWVLDFLKKRFIAYHNDFLVIFSLVNSYFVF